VPNAKVNKYMMLNYISSLYLPDVMLSYSGNCTVVISFPPFTVWRRQTAGTDTIT